MDEMDMALGMEPGGKKQGYKKRELQEIRAARNGGGGVLREDANLCEVMR
jgi:hypothetical protein